MCVPAHAHAITCVSGNSMVICNAFCKFFYQNWKQLMFFQKIFWNQKHVTNQFKQEKLFCHVIVKNYLCNTSWKFLIKIQSTWRHEIKEQSPQLILLYHSRTVRSSHWSYCIRKLFLKTLQYPQETPVLEPNFEKVADL